MARTPLLYAFQRLVSEHIEATEKGISVEEVRKQRRTAISRRDFLKRAGVIATGVALAGPFELARHALAVTAPRIAIIGGGISGTFPNGL
jgi:monoamine oxidase